MNSQEAFVAVVATALGLSFPVAMLWIWLRYRAGRSQPDQKVLRGVEDRLTRLEQAVDVISESTERILEGQRFTTQVLTRSSSASQSVSGGGEEGPLPVQEPKRG